MKNPENSNLTSEYRWVILGINVAAHAGVVMAGMALAPLAPFVLGDLASNRAEIGMLIAALVLGVAIGSTPGGWLADRSTRGTLVGGQVLLGISVLLVSWVPSLEAALALLAVGGLGFGAVITTNARAIASWFPSQGRATAMGLTMAAAPLGNVIISIGMPVLGEAWGWRLALVPAALLLLGSAVASALLFRPLPGEARRASGSSQEKHGAWDMLRRRDPWLLILVAVLMGASEHVFRSYFLLYATEVVLIPVVLGGWLLALAHASGLCGRVAWGIISDRWFAGDREGVFALLAVGASLSTLLLGLGWGAPWILPVLAIGFGLTGGGWAAVWAILILDRASTASSGSHIGVSMTFSSVGIILAPILFGRGVDVTGSYQAMWLAIAAITMPVVAIALVLRKSRRKERLGV